MHTYIHEVLKKKCYHIPENFMQFFFKYHFQKFQGKKLKIEKITKINLTSFGLDKNQSTNITRTGNYDVTLGALDRHLIVEMKVNFQELRYVLN